jgi:protocatechuate 3,4-dioxygenase beta subunit
MSAGRFHPRPHLLGALVVFAVALGTTAPVVAQETDEPVALTPSQQEGPYYPVEIPVDHDADLTVVGESEVVATGQPLMLEGVLLDAGGAPIEGAVVEIWQTDAFGVYLHPGDPGYADRDAAFQGFGASSTDAQGTWAFRTILPELYGGRPRHIHAKVKVDDETVLTTQIYFSGGDIPSDGALEETGSELDALLVEVHAAADEDGTEVLTAHHLLVVP